MADVKIEIRANGPYRVTGPLDLVDTDGNAYTIPEGQCRHYRGEYRNSPLGRLLAPRAISAGGAHGLEFVEIVATGRAVIFVERHVHLPRWQNLLVT